MNPLSRFKQWNIGDALAKTDDVFEKARIELIFGFSVFLSLLSTLFFGQLIAGHYTYHLYNNIFGFLVMFPVFYYLKKNETYKSAVAFMIGQCIISISSMIIQNGQLDLTAMLWSMLQIMFSFFVLNKAWGWFTCFYIAVLMLVCLINDMTARAIFDFPIPPDQILPQADLFSLVPFALNVYFIYKFTSANQEAGKQIGKQKLSLIKSNAELETQKRDSIASINYARRIQYAVLPQEENIYRNIPLSFIIYKPKDIVSGDFYWFHEIDKNNYIIACGDCTGHGVPGALMTVIGSNLLNQAVIDNRVVQPAAILNELDRLITITLKQQLEHENYVQDGMDMALLRVDKAKKEFVFASAKRPGILIRNKQLEEIKGSKFALGGMTSDGKTFGETIINYSEGDIIYLFTDGCTDQFGGEKGKKFSIRQLREVLLSMHSKKPGDQKQLLEITGNKITNKWMIFY